MHINDYIWFINHLPSGMHIQQMISGHQPGRKGRQGEAKPVARKSVLDAKGALGQLGVICSVVGLCGFI